MRANAVRAAVAIVASTILTSGRGRDGVDAPGGRGVPEWGRCRPLKEASMNQVSTVGLDLAKYIFQLHGADSAGAVVFRKRGQGAARQDLQDGRALAPTLADHRRPRGGPLGRAQGGSGWLVAGGPGPPQAADAGAGGAGQQDGPDRLGAAGQGWGVSSSGCGGVGAVTTARLS